jgi:tripartite-type tricarboxylate transporter receptor subunit TctC
MNSARARLLGLVLICLAEGASPQGYPAKPIRIVVGFPPGGGNDIIARMVGAKMQEAWGQPVVVDNKPGANSIIAAEFVAKSAPDGYTLLVNATGGMSVNPVLYTKLPYDSLKDFVPISMVGSFPLVLVVHPSVPAKSVAELVAYAKSNPGKLAYGSAGSGSLPHLATELFKASTGTDIVHVPYKGGGPMVTDLLGGTVQVVIGDQANLMPHVKSGKLRALAVASPRRSANYPDIPTIAEGGVPGFQAVAWNGLVGPAGLPPEVVKRVHEAFAKVMALPDVREKLQGGGLDPVGDSPEEFGRFIPAEIAKWSKIAKDVGARAD